MSARTGWRAGEKLVFAWCRSRSRIGQDEGGGLAGPGLGGGEDVAAGEDERDGGCLDRGGGLVALLGDDLEEIGRQAERVEGQACAPAWIAIARARGARRWPKRSRWCDAGVRASIADIAVRRAPIEARCVPRASGQGRPVRLAILRPSAPKRPQHR